MTPECCTAWQHHVLYVEEMWPALISVIAFHKNAEHARSQSSAGFDLLHTFAGTIPASWGMNGAFPYLARLSLFANQLTGSIPAA